MRWRYEQRLTPADVGARVSIRRWVDDPERGRVPSDVVGRLTAWEDDVLTVVPRDGEPRSVPLGEILASRVIPEPPPRRRGPSTAGG